MNDWTATERRWRDQLMAAQIPAGQDGSLPALDDLDLAPFWADLQRQAPPLVRLGLRVAVWTLTLCPLLLIGRFCTFGGLHSLDRDRLLGRAAASRWYLLRQLATLLKALACLAYFRDSAARVAFEPNDEPASLPERASSGRP